MAAPSSWKSGKKSPSGLRAAPDMPRHLLPGDWIGNEAYRVAADLYHRLSQEAASALGEILEVDYPSRMPNRLET